MYYNSNYTIDMTKKIKRQTIKQRKTRKSKSKGKGKGQKGGFYPSVYDGVVRATLLAPFAARQAYDFWNRRKTRKSKK
jgi:hypothetical protein